MEYNELVSVVMPVHNGEKYLREAIESVLDQTYTNFEFLLIENCSSDSSVELIKSYNDTRMRLIFEDDCGIVQGYNRGFREAKGEFIIIHDQDDISSQYRIESQIHYLLKKDLDLCGSGFKIVDEQGKYIKSMNPPLEKSEIIERIFFDFFSLFNPTIALRKKVILKLNYFDIKFPIGTDYDFLLKSLLDFKCGNNGRLLLKYRIHKNNTSNKDPKLGEKIVRSLALNHFDKFIPLFRDTNYTLSRLYFFYGNYFLSTKFMLKSIHSLGFRLIKVKYLLFSTVFVIPVYILRKRGLFYNKFINKVLYFIQINI